MEELETGRHFVSPSALIHVVSYLEFSSTYFLKVFFPKKYLSHYNKKLQVALKSKWWWGVGGQKVDVTEGLLHPIMFLKLAFFIR